MLNYQSPIFERRIVGGIAWIKKYVGDDFGLDKRAVIIENVVPYS